MKVTPTGSDNLWIYLINTSTADTDGVGDRWIGKSLAGQTPEWGGAKKAGVQ